MAPKLLWHPKIKRLPRREDMTLCVAAFGQDEIGKVHFCWCANKRIETHSTGSETIYKYRKLSPSWAALYAGTVARADELVSLYVTHLRGMDLDLHSAIEELRKPPQVLKRRLVEEYVQNTLAMSYDDFLSKGPSLPASLYETIASEVSRLEIGCQLILIPVPAANIRFFFTVDVSGSVYQEQNFAAIGSGASNALAWLHFRNHSQFTNVNKTLFHVWEAKKFAENAPGVGKDTAMGWTSDTLKSRNINDFRPFEIQWAKYGPKATKKMTADLKTAFHQEHNWEDIGAG